MNILKSVKKKFKNFSFKKTAAIITTLCFVVSIVFSQSAYAVMPVPNSVPVTPNLNTPIKSLIPFNLGRITDAFYSNDGDIVINIQDLHSHEQTQRNISSILSILDKNFGLKDIYLEGATGTVNTQWLSDIKDNSTKQKVLNNLLASGRLTGGEYFAVQTNRNNIIKGLEDKNLYTENFKILSDMYNKETEIKNYISVLNNLFNKKSEQYISDGNKKINKIIESYKQDKIKTNKYIELLLKKAQKTDINLSKYGTIIKFAQIISKQKAFDVNKLNGEIAELLKELKEKLSFQEYKALTEKATKKEFEVEFYFDLLKKAKDLNLLTGKKYTNTGAFLEYLVLNQNINTVNLANEEKLFVNELKDKFAKTQAEKDMYFLQQNLEYLSQYLTNKMTAKDYEQFAENIANFKLLWEKYIDIDNLTNLTEYFDLADIFYNNNIERNRVFIKNMFGKKVNEAVDGLRIKNASINHKDKVLDAIANGRKIHVVITGGFHTYGFNKLLEDENINYIVITPNITEETATAETLYKNVFSEQYDITNTTFANMPISQIVALLNKGEIKDIKPVGNSVEIEYVSGAKETLSDLSQQQTAEETLTTEQAKLVADVIIAIQELKRINRENIRIQQQDGVATIPSADIENRIRTGLSKITDENLRSTLEGKIQDELPAQALTKKSVKKRFWYKALTKLGLITIRESLVAVSEQKYFDNIFQEEVLGQIIAADQSAREKFLQEHELYGEDEKVTTQLNEGVTSVIAAMNEAYKQVSGLFGIHSIAQLAAKIAGAKAHKEHNVSIYYDSSKGSKFLLTKGEQKRYQVKFKTTIRINGYQVSYDTEKDKDAPNVSYTTAPSKEKAFSNVVDKAAERILEIAGLDKNQFMNLARYLIRQDLLKIRHIPMNKLVTEIEENTKEDQLNATRPKPTRKLYSNGQKSEDTYHFTIKIPGINDSSELAVFQSVSAKSPKQAVWRVVYLICKATDEGKLTGGMYEGLSFTGRNVHDIEQAVIRNNPVLSKLIENNDHPINKAPTKRKGITPKQITHQLSIGEKEYIVTIPDFNDTDELEQYRHVFAVDDADAIVKAVEAILNARKRNEIVGGYYNYIAINDDKSRDNRAIIIDAIKKSKTAVVTEVVEQAAVTEEKAVEQQEEEKPVEKYKNLTDTDAYQKLLEYAGHKGSNLKTIKELFAGDKGKPQSEQRGRIFSRIFKLGNDQLFRFDFSKTNIDEKLLERFGKLLEEVKFEERRDAMLSGEIYNLTEKRAVLHTALRNVELDKNGELKAKSSILFKGKDVMPDIIKVLNKMKSFSDKIITGEWKGVTGEEITDVVSIGIGGSDLGPRMATEALSTFNKGRRVHFVSNVDPNDIDSTLNGLGLDPKKTLFIIESKTFTTDETITNAKAAKKWVTDRLGADPEVIKKHFVAVSTNKEEVSKFGIDTNNMFEFWDWVGGRFSVWSAVGLPLMCSVGFENFIEFLAGASDIDENFKNKDITQNIPVLMAILNVLERNIFDRSTYFILPYNDYLKSFMPHIQQLYMESLGKSVNIYGERINYKTGSMITGGTGTNAQHSFFQSNHQGTDINPADFMAFALTSANITDETLQVSQDKLLSNNLAQQEAMAFGRTYEETVAKLVSEGTDEKTAREKANAQTFDGNRPSTSMLFDELTPRTLGASIALYEDMVATLGIIWNINAFDQEGVQLGKTNAKKTFKGLQGEDIEFDSSTEASIEFIAASKAKKQASIASGAEIPEKIATNIISATKKDKTSVQQEQSNLQNLISQLNDSKNDTELKDAIEKMLNAGFKEQYIEKLLSQYLDLRNGNIPQDIYSKTEQIKFGTAGVRGIMGEEVDFLDMVIITQAISNVISSIAAKQNIDPKDIKILVGGDSRFLSKQFAEIVSKILAANGINVVISSDDIPSPTISYYTREKGFTLSINITASHNPKEHNGYKITLGDGGQAGTDVTTMIENEIKNIQDQLAANTDPGINIVTDSEQITPIDVKDTFIKAFVKMITGVFGMNDNTSLNKFKQKAKEWTVVVDPKNGATKRYYAEILKLFGFNVIMINDEVDPTFKGQKPEPSFENTEKLRTEVKSITKDNLLGISTDVDGDRFAVVDKDGNFVTANEIGTILLNFRLQTLFDNLISEITAAQGNKEKQNEILKKFLGRKLIVPRNCATTHVLDDLAAKLVSEYSDKLKGFDLDPQLLKQFESCVDVKEVNVGFKYFAQAKHDAEDNGDLFLLGVESSGGISIAEWIYDKCGFLANLMLLFVLVENGKQPEDILSEVYSDISYAPQGIETTIKFREIVAKDSEFDTPGKISAEAKKRQERLMSTIKQLKGQEKFSGIKHLFAHIDRDLVIKEIRDNDGIKIIFENGAWLLIRPSGTEPIVRIFDETKGNESLSKELVKFVTDNGGQDLIDAVEKALGAKTTPFKANWELFKIVVENSVKALQRLTYSVLFKDNMEYTIVSDATDLARIEKANELSNRGIKVNLVLIGETNLVQEADSRISTADGDLAFCLTSKPNENLTVYGYDDNSYGQTVNISNITKQDALIALLKHINDKSKREIKILNLPNNLDRNIITPDVEEKARNMFSVLGVGKTTLNLFSEALKNKLEPLDNMTLTPSLIASNLSAEQIDNFGQKDIDKFAKQGIATIIISADDKLLQEKSQSLKTLLQMAHNSGLKVMFNYSFDLKQMTTNEFENWISSFDEKFQQFKENGGIDGLQVDLSQSGVLASNPKVLSLLSDLSKIVNEQNVGSFLAIKMPSDIYPTEFLNLCNSKGIKLVADYDSPLVSVGISNLKAGNLIINISADKNGFISVEKMSKLFESKNNTTALSMISLDLPILEAIDTSEVSSFNGLSITNFINSIFETTPEGQNLKGINKGRNFVKKRDSVINEGVMRRLYEMYVSDNFNIQEINRMLDYNFGENISKYELKGIVEGLLQATELKIIKADNLSFDKKEYANLLMQALMEYRIASKEETFKELSISDDIEQILNIDNFRAELKQEIERVHTILNTSGTIEDRQDTVINILNSLKDNPELTSQERAMVLEGLLSLLLGYATPTIDTDKLMSEESLENIKAILRAA